jgi:hypothetical protein
MPTKRTANRCVKSPTVTEPAPAPAPQCFMQPCSGRQVTLRVLNCLPHMTACYLHATDIVAMLKHDYPDICLEPLSYRGASTHRQSPISACAAPRGPLAAPSAPVPTHPCLLHGSCGKPGSLTIHSTLAAAKSVLYSCPSCLSSIVAALREMGHVNIYCGNVLPTWWPLVPPVPSLSADA